MDNGWIKLYRSLEQWDWWDDHNTTRLWTWILLHANHEENKWRGKIIKSGQFISSQPKMAEATGLGVQSIRTSLNRLKSTGELTVEITNSYSLIQVNNWQKYQDTNTQTNRRTNSQLTGDQQATNNKQELKNERIKELNTLVGLEPTISNIVEKWNTIRTDKLQNNTSVKPGVPILPKCRNITDDLKTIIQKQVKAYGEEGIIGAITEYATEIVLRKDDAGGYYRHRFRLIEFMEQKNGLRKFIT